MNQHERVLSLRGLLDRDQTAEKVSQIWSDLKAQIQPKLDECKEIRDYVFATDTTTTSVQDGVPEEMRWKNNTHLPKLCEIRDTLISIYKTTWFPNDNWLKWNAYTLDKQTKEKKAVIEAYVKNKARQSGFETLVGNQLAKDFTDYGNIFCEAVWRDDRVYNDDGVLEKTGYVGPEGRRISPEDIVFDLTAASFKDSPKIVRRVMTLGDAVLWAKNIEVSDPDMASKIMSALKERHEACRYSSDDWNKVESYAVDGFGNYYTYMQSEKVEVLDFRGSLYDADSGELKQDHQILVMDRRVVLKDAPWEEYMRDGGIYHCAYRERPDNLWGMGPLDNLVGMQYRIDHLQGAKDDNVDLHIHPRKKKRGDPIQQGSGPDEVWLLGEGDDIEFESPDLSHLTLDNEIEYLLRLMEEFAGSPKQARGFRTPGEKTLGEVSLLEGNSNRLFLDKAIKVEKEVIEPLANAYAFLGRINLEGSEAVQIFDSEEGLYKMLTIRKKDLEADGLLQPIGARHFGQRNQMMTDLLNLSNSNVWPLMAPHMSGLQMAELVKDSLQLARFGLISQNAQLYEAAEAERVQMQIGKEIANEAEVDTESDLDEIGGLGE